MTGTRPRGFLQSGCHAHRCSTPARRAISLQTLSATGGAWNRGSPLRRLASRRMRKTFPIRLRALSSKTRQQAQRTASLHPPDPTARTSSSALIIVRFGRLADLRELQCRPAVGGALLRGGRIHLRGRSKHMSPQRLLQIRGRIVESATGPAAARASSPSRRCSERSTSAMSTAMTVDTRQTVGHTRAALSR